MSGPGRDEPHQIFLHQAVLSALITRWIRPECIRIPPPSYSYPLHLHAKTPPARRARALEELVVAVYEEQFPDPSVLADIQVSEPLRSWLEQRAPGVPDK